MTIAEMQKRAWENSEAHGFHETEADRNLPTKLMLIVSELAEAMEELRRLPEEISRLKFSAHDSKPVGFASELADAVIRIGDLAEMCGIDLTEAVTVKMAYNETRAVRHGGKSF